MKLKISSVSSEVSGIISEILVEENNKVTHGVNPKAIATMKADGIDIADNTSNNVLEYKDIPFDFIITVCDNAKERCPYFPSNAIKFHYNFPDPAKATGTEEEINNSFASTRDLIKKYCADFVQQHL